MNLKEQQYIVTLANYGNMTQAAKKLGVTQPALSSYLSSVENGLGFPLFERTGRRLIPTYLGEVYLEKARKILALGEEFQQQVGQVISGYQGRLRVGRLSGTASGGRAPPPGAAADSLRPESLSPVLSQH